MFPLTTEEWQEVITDCDNLPQNLKFTPALPFAFTEQGVAMLSSVLKSPKAIEMNIAIMRAFVLLRQYHMDYKELKAHMDKLEIEMSRKFKDIHEALNYLLDPPQPKRNPIGFRPQK